MGARMGVPVCVRVSGCACLFFFLLALIGKMKSASWIELGSASFLCLGPKPPGPEIGKFPSALHAGLGGKHVKGWRV